GECHYAKARYEQAIESWNQLLRDYPSSDKLPDARFKKGLALEKLGRRREALVEYRYVMDRFPNSEAGRRAREKLNPYSIGGGRCPRLRENDGERQQGDPGRQPRARSRDPL